MTNIEKISDCIESWPNGVCDRCLGELTEVQPHQQIVQVCNKLDQRHETLRSSGICSRCGKSRLINNPTDRSESGARESSPRTPPSLGQVDAGWLDERRRQIVRILNRLEGCTPKGEMFGKHVSRLRDAGTLPGDIAALMMTLTAFRGLVLYEEHPLTETEADILRLAWVALEKWTASDPKTH